MVTGSVGKTSTKDAVAAALSHKFNLRKSDKSYNSDFGVPLTIIGVSNPWASPIAWIKVFIHAFELRFISNEYPELLVLEVGADTPGDLAKILKITKPDTVVVTLLPEVPVHVEAYATPAAVREEEFSPALALPVGAPLIISADDTFAVAKSERIDQDLYTYGTNPDADVHIVGIDIWKGKKEGEILGMLATVEAHGKSYALHVRGAIGRSQLYAPTAAIAVALSQGMTVEEALEGLESYLPPPGRGRIFAGKKDALLIDDTYNSSPKAVEEILKSLELIPGKHRKIVVLGDMLELGRYSIAEHAHVGHLAKEVSDILITVGHRAKGISDAALADGMSVGSVVHFDTSVEAAAHVEGLIEEGDVVLVKGSQGIRMERIVRPLLADFTDTQNLVRQDVEWLKR